MASYPFTTLHPHIGTVAYRDGKTIQVADIPGLIEGAHADRGLGHEFLRHIERCKALVYVIDASATSGGNADTVGDLHALQAELALYNPALPLRPSIVVANKMDLGSSSQVGLQRLRQATALPVLPISAVTREGISEFVASVRFLLDS